MRKAILILTMCIALIGSAMAQKTISGKVTDSKDGSSLPGVNILVKGTNKGVSTDINGAYKLIVPNDAKTLVFSMIGFAQQEVAIGNQSVINVEMKLSDKELEEVIITGLGISKKNRATGFAAPTISADQIVSKGTPNVASALYGKAAGVRIATSPGGATSGVNIQVRGLNSITGKSQPLIIVDGMPIRDGEFNNGNYWGDQRARGNGFLDINPEDIESLTVLKGASAAALYGSEAVNGVLVITTKSGKGKKGFSVDVNATTSIDKLAYFPRYQNVRGAGAPLQVNNGGQAEDGFYYYDLNNDGTKETRALLGYSINFGPKFDGKPILCWDGVTRPYEAQENNIQNLFQDATSKMVNVAMSNSNENSNVRLSLTRQDNEGSSLDSRNVKNIINLNSSYKFGKFYSLDFVVNYLNQYTHNRPYLIDRMINNFTGMMGRFDNGLWYLDKYKTSKGYRFVTGTTQSLTPDENIKINGYRADILDYVWSTKENNYEEYANRLYSTFTNNFNFTKNLNLRARIGTDYTATRTTNKSTSSIPLAFGYSGGYSLNNGIDYLLYGDVLLTYTQKLNDNFELSAMGGYTARKSYSSYTSVSTNGGLSTENRFDLSSSVNTPYASGSISTFVTDAYLGTLNLNFKNYWYIEGTVRRDRTSTMHPSQNSFVYPSANTSFILSDALTLPSFIDYAKLRASWGIVGNYPGQYIANIAYNASSLGIQQTGGKPVLLTTLPTSFGNDAIRPEEKHETEIGFDAKMFRKKLSIDFAYYTGKTVDQILSLTLPISSGAGSVLTNIGTLSNRGIDLQLVATPVQTKDVYLEIGLNFNKNQNRVEKLANNATELLHADYDGGAAQLKSVVGNPIGDFYYRPVKTNSSGQKIVGADGLYVLDDTKWERKGNTQPKAFGGIFSTFAVKGFTLDWLVDYRIGGYVMPTGLYWMTSRGLTEESLNYMDKEHGGLSYYMDGDRGVLTTAATGPKGEKVYDDGMLLDGVTADGKQNTNVVSQAYYYWVVYNWGGPQYGVSRYELYMNELTYFKLREASLGYTLPKNLSAKLGATKLTLSVFGRNLFYFYRSIKDMDAEATTTGSRWSNNVSNAGVNPSTRTFGVMLRANF